MFKRHNGRTQFIFANDYRVVVEFPSTDESSHQTFLGNLVAAQVFDPTGWVESSERYTANGLAELLARIAGLPDQFPVATDVSAAATDHPLM